MIWTIIGGLYCGEEGSKVSRSAGVKASGGLRAPPSPRLWCWCGRLWTVAGWQATITLHHPPQTLTPLFIHIPLSCSKKHTSHPLNLTAQLSVCGCLLEVQAVVVDFEVFSQRCVEGRTRHRRRARGGTPSV